MNSNVLAILRMYIDKGIAGIIVLWRQFIAPVDVLEYTLFEMWGWQYCFSKRRFLYSPLHSHHFSIQ